MSNLHRLQWIDAMIRARRYPNCRRIADKFEISARQAARDIEYLRDSLSAPIEYSAEHNGYYYTSEAFVLPAVMVSEEERRALAVLAEQYARVHSQTGARLAEIFSRLAGPVSAGKERGALLLAEALRAEEVEAYQVLRQAIDERRVVQVVYRGQAGERTERAFCPYKLYTKMRVYYVVGYCRLREGLRTLRLDRIEKLAPTSASFEIVPYYREQDYGEEAPFSFANPYVATLRLVGPFDPRTSRWRVLEQDGDVYRVEFRHSDELITYLLTLPAEFAILSPRWLRERLLERLNRIRARNLGTDATDGVRQRE
jgi:predicted DNA-binding transcriptional regulator YafY